MFAMRFVSEFAPGYAAKAVALGEAVFYRTTEAVTYALDTLQEAYREISLTALEKVDDMRGFDRLRECREITAKLFASMFIAAREYLSEVDYVFVASVASLLILALLCLWLVRVALRAFVYTAALAIRWMRMAAALIRSRIVRMNTMRKEWTRALCAYCVWTTQTVSKGALRRARRVIAYVDSIEEEGDECFDRPCTVVANHPDDIDQVEKMVTSLTIDAEGHTLPPIRLDHLRRVTSLKLLDLGKGTKVMSLPPNVETIELDESSSFIYTDNPAGIRDGVTLKGVVEYSNTYPLPWTEHLVYELGHRTPHVLDLRRFPRLRRITFLGQVSYIPYLRYNKGLDVYFSFTVRGEDCLQLYSLPPDEVIRRCIYNPVRGYGDLSHERNKCVTDLTFELNGKTSDKKGDFTDHCNLKIARLYIRGSKPRVNFSLPKNIVLVELDANLLSSYSFSRKGTLLCPGRVKNVNSEYETDDYGGARVLYFHMKGGARLAHKIQGDTPEAYKTFADTNITTVIINPHSWGVFEITDGFQAIYSHLSRYECIEGCDSETLQVLTVNLPSKGVRINAPNLKVLALCVDPTGDKEEVLKGIYATMENLAKSAPHNFHPLLALCVTYPLTYGDMRDMACKFGYESFNLLRYFFFLNEHVFVNEPAFLKARFVGSVNPMATLFKYFTRNGEASHLVPNDLYLYDWDACESYYRSLY